MIELVITQMYRDGYKVVVPTQLKPKLRLLPYVDKCVYTDPEEIKTGDRLVFVDWVNSTDTDKAKWMKHFVS